LRLADLDPGIRHAVEVLRAAGVETFESCEGGPGHANPDPMVRFHGEQSEGFRAYAVAAANGLRVLELRRSWSSQDGELTERRRQRPHDSASGSHTARRGGWIPSHSRGLGTVHGDPRCYEARTDCWGRNRRWGRVSRGL